MTTPRRNAPEPRVGRPRWLAALVALGAILAGQAASAAPSSIAPTPAATGQDDHGHSCKCGPRCRGASCCCGPKPTRPAPGPRRVETPAADPSPSPPPDGPCLGAAPCGDDAIPSGSSAPPVSRTAALAASSAAAPGVDDGRPLAPEAPLGRPARPASRLDRPPRTGSPARAA